MKREVQHANTLNVSHIGSLVFAALMLISPGIVFAAWTNGQNAITVIGQADFTSAVFGLSATRISGPGGVCVDPTTGDLWVADYDANRILKWTAANKTINGSAASVVLGQVDFTSNVGGTTASKLKHPIGMVIDSSGRMFLADRDNHRILRFDNVAAKATGASADGVLGQANFTSGTDNRGGAAAANTMSAPWSVSISSTGAIWVADSANNRVLRFDNAAAKANGAAADGVLGQADFTSITANRGGAAAANTLRWPYAVTITAAGVLYVGDGMNNRVLRFDNAAAKADGAAADGVLGQADFTSVAANRGGAAAANTMNVVYGVTADASGGLYITDANNRRVLYFSNAAAKADGAAADNVLGQPDFTTIAATLTAAGLGNEPMALAFEDAVGKLWIPVRGQKRVLVYYNAALVPWIPVPTLSEWGMITMTLLIGMSALHALREKTANQLGVFFRFSLRSPPVKSHFPVSFSVSQFLIRSLCSG